MSFTNTYSREELQSLQAKHRKDSLIQYIEYYITNLVLSKAREGKTECFWKDPIPKNYIGGQPNPTPSPYTNEELIGALKEKFPDTTVEYQETWVDVRPGVKEQKKGILIDWS